MAVVISGVVKGSYADKANIREGHTLLSVNGHDIEDVLDYRFYIDEPSLLLNLSGGGSRYSVRITKKDEDADLGLEFETYLMDRQRSCRNNCIFCFIDQLPQGLRESLYFKDDDSRLSFLFGNYITLTNLSDSDVDRIINMHISPVNVSVHTMNPELRCKMMNNRFAGESLKYLEKLAQNGTRLNTQLVLCPGVNDGEELESTLEKLFALGEAVQSIAAVPVGLTKHREGLCELEPYTAEGAGKVLDIIDGFNERVMAVRGRRAAFAADEFYLKAGREVPDAAYYDDFYQLDNGVGMLSLMDDEFNNALKLGDDVMRPRRRVTLATGEAAYEQMCRLAQAAQQRYKWLSAEVIKVENNFFGNSVTVAGLLTGSDFLTALRGRELGDELLIPRCSLRHEGDLFLDGMSLQDLKKRLSAVITPVENDGCILFDRITGLGGEA